jgi:hypothetical protein
VCPPVLKPACSPPYQLAREYREQTDAKYGRAHQTDVVRRPPKMMEGSEILHDELPLEGRYDLLQ